MPRSEEDGAGAIWRNELGGPRVGFTRAVFGLIVTSALSAERIDREGKYKPPTRKPDAWGTLVS
jgi:hypothetical protein